MCRTSRERPLQVFLPFPAFDRAAHTSNPMMFSKPICWLFFALRYLATVPSSEKFQFVIVETLNADADAVEGQPTEHADICGRKIVGVGFQRNLNEVVHRKFGIQGVKNLFNMFLLQARRRSSPEINRPNGFVCKHLFSQAYFSAYRFGKFVDRGFVCLRIKIAVDAPRFAERNMKINPCQYYFFSLMISRTKSGSSVVM